MKTLYFIRSRFNGTPAHEWLYGANVHMLQLAHYNQLMKFIDEMFLVDESVKCKTHIWFFQTKFSPDLKM